jgi:hypothetical protein
MPIDRDDTFEYDGHKVKGLNLHRSVLKKVYHDNAVHWIPGIDANPRRKIKDGPLRHAVVTQTGL